MAIPLGILSGEVHPVKAESPPSILKKYLILWQSPTLAVRLSLLPSQYIINAVDYLL